MTKTSRVDSDRLREILLEPGATLRSAIERIDAGAMEIALLVDRADRLLGTITDGDVRRALLDGARLEDSVEPIVHRDPITAPTDVDDRALVRLMSERGVDQIPLIEGDRVVDIAFLRDLVAAYGDPRETRSDGPVVLMAGGKGTRLRPLTDKTPKPMLPVGGRPLLETVLDQVCDAGFSRVLIAVSHQAEVIERHFGDGSRFNIEVAYLHESSPLGSAGALRLAAAQLDRPFIVMNADLLTNVKLSALMRFHREEGNAVTVGVRQYALDLPYGVVEMGERACCPCVRSQG